MSDKDKNNEAVAAYDWEVVLRNSDCDAIRRMSPCRTDIALPFS